MNKERIKNLLLSIGICLFFAIIGGLLAGDALDNWFMEIKQPWFSLPLWGWYIVGVIYYVLCITILYRLFSSKKESRRDVIIGLTLAMIVGNEFWNYLFFGLESTFSAFVGLIPFVVLVVVLFVKLWNYQRTTAWVLFPYLPWLVYDLLWTYNLWILNS